MKNIYIIRNLILIVFLLIGVRIMANPTVDKKTFVYSAKGGIELKLDKYTTTKLENSPCIIFAFGGGFFTGTRDREDYIPHFQHFANKGYVVISIDYRLGLKPDPSKTESESESKKKPGIKDLINALNYSVTVATEDILDATAYILKNATDWGINKNLITVTGSSAGAIAALNSEYNVCNKTELAKVLPANFKYAGVISYAGAIFVAKGKPKWKNKPAPMLLFHGTADSNVPYNKLKVPFISAGFYGSKYIVNQLKKLKSPYYFYDVENATHVIADLPITQNFNEIETFLQKMVINKQNISVHTEVKQLDKTKKKKIKLKDYLSSNKLN